MESRGRLCIDLLVSTLSSRKRESDQIESHPNPDLRLNTLSALSHFVFACCHLLSNVFH